MWWSGEKSNFCMWFLDENDECFRWDVVYNGREFYPQTSALYNNGHLEKSNLTFAKESYEYLVFPRELT